MFTRNIESFDKQAEIEACVKLDSLNTRIFNQIITIIRGSLLFVGEEFTIFFSDSL